MTKKIFALKVTEREKEVMDLTAKVFDMNLARIYYPALRDEIHRRFGILLLDMINKQRISARNENLAQILEDSSKSKELPTVVRDFLEVLTEPLHRNEFSEFFSRVRIVPKVSYAKYLDLSEYLSGLGREYLESDSSVKDIDLDMVYDIFFDHMLEFFYRYSAEGSIDALTEEWELNAPKIVLFKRKLIRAYERKFASDFVEVVEVEALEDEKEQTEEQKGEDPEVEQEKEGHKEKDM